MNIAYVFDVDGTLTKPRQKITNKFERYFKKWSADKDVFICTGSDFIKTKEQLGNDILTSFQEIYCCMGNETRDRNGLVTFKSDFTLPRELDLDLSSILEKSEYPVKTGNHIEFRSGMVNFSIVGRNADFTERRDYNQWDSINKEREAIANHINKNYPFIEASVGGSISIDIIEKGKDKGQIVYNLINKGYESINFYGDKCHKGGNDYGVVRELEISQLEYKWINVHGPEYLMEILKHEETEANIYSE